MIALMKRILSVSGPYQGRIKLAFVFAFLKAMLSKALQRLRRSPRLSVQS